MKKRVQAILGLIAYILFIIWFTIKDLPAINEKLKNGAEKNSVVVEEVAVEK